MKGRPLSSLVHGRTPLLYIGPIPIMPSGWNREQLGQDSDADLVRPEGGQYNHPSSTHIFRSKRARVAKAKSPPSRSRSRPS